MKPKESGPTPPLTGSDSVSTSPASAVEHTRAELLGDLARWLQSTIPISQRNLLRPERSDAPVTFDFGNPLVTRMYPKGGIEGFKRDCLPVLETAAKDLTELIGLPVNGRLPVIWHSQESTKSQNAYALGHLMRTQDEVGERTYYNGASGILFDGILEFSQNGVVRHELGHVWTFDGLPSLMGIHEAAAQLLENKDIATEEFQLCGDSYSGVRLLAGAPAFGTPEHTNLDVDVQISRLFFRLQKQEFVVAAGGAHNAVRIIAEAKKRAASQPRDPELGVPVPTLKEWLTIGESVAKGFRERMERGCLLHPFTTDPIVLCATRLDWGISVVRGIFTPNSNIEAEKIHDARPPNAGTVSPLPIGLKVSFAGVDGRATSNISQLFHIAPMTIQKVYAHLTKNEGAVPPIGTIVRIELEDVAQPIELAWNETACSMIPTTSSPRQPGGTP